MLEVYKPHSNRVAVGVWLCSAAKRPRKRSALVIIQMAGLNPLFISEQEQQESLDWGEFSGIVVIHWISMMISN